MPDSLYENVEVARFINQLMRRGKKTVAQKIVYQAFAIIEEKTKQKPLAVFDKALENTIPATEVRSKRVGGATYQVPIPVRGDRGLALAMRWLIKSAKAKKGKDMAERLAQEITDASNNLGEAVKKKNEMHKIAEANRAFAHFAW